MAPRKLPSPEAVSNDVKAGMSTTEIAKKYGIKNTNYLVRYMDNNGIRRPAPRRGPGSGTTTKEIVGFTEREKEITRWLADGKSVEEISIITGRNSWVIRHDVKKARERHGLANVAALVAKSLREGHIS